MDRGEPGNRRRQRARVRSLPRNAADTALVRFQVPPPENSVITSFTLFSGRAVSRVCRGGCQLWLRPIDSLEARALPGTDGVSSHPDSLFWSPDSTFLGFITQGQLKRISVNGGPPESLADVPNRSRASWGREGVILFASGTGRPNPASAGGRWRARRGNQAAAGEVPHAPQFLPDGRHFLLSRQSGARLKATGFT